MTKHLVIFDTQVKPGQDLSYLSHIGQYIVDKKPDVVIQIGDFADMPSLSSYDKGKKSFEGRRYSEDVAAAELAMIALLEPISNYNNNSVKLHKPRYKPRLVLTLGNHENRINRAIDEDSKLEGTISVADLKYEQYNWEVHPFLEVVVIDGVAYSHYFTSGVMQRPVTSAAALLSKKHMSCIAGHQQGRQIACSQRADGKNMTAVICGSSYEHTEEYLGAQGNQHFRGIMMLHNVDDGQFDEMFVSLDYLRSKYENN